MTKDYYKILGIEKGASETDIKKAYRKLAREHHPDANSGNKKSEEKFKEIGEAYDVLKDKERRSNYDLYGDPDGRTGWNPRGRHYRTDTHEINLEELLRRATGFGRGGGFDPFEELVRARQTARATPRNINVAYQLSLEEAFTGKQVTATINIPNNGQKKLDVVIPAGIENGSRIRFAGEGVQHHMQTVPGDIYITINIKPHIRFQRMGQTLYTTASVNVIDAILGTRVQFQGIDGKMLSLNIPAGTQHGDQLRLKGQGFSIQGMTNRGDLLVEVHLIVPRTLRAEEEALLRQLKSLQEKRQ